MIQALNNLISGFVSLLQGMGVTLRTMLRPVTTVQYPDQKLTMSPRWRGVLSLEVSKCTACGACVRSCPAKLLDVVSHMEEDKETGKKKRKLDEFLWFNDGCAHCDLCSSACPTEALAFHHDYEIASFKRESLLVDLAAVKTAEVGDLPTGFALEDVSTVTPGGGIGPIPGGKS